MKKIQKVGIVLIIVLGLLAGCGKSVEKQADCGAVGTWK